MFDQGFNNKAPLGYFLRHASHSPRVLWRTIGVFGSWCLVETNDAMETKKTIFRAITIQYGLLRNVLVFVSYNTNSKQNTNTKITIYGLVHLGV